MFETLVVFAALHQWLTFGPEPLADQVAEGKKLYAKGKGIERTLRDGRSVIGVWFDGRIRDDVESMVWVSPRMASRWLGYLEAKEKWSKSEMLTRWAEIRAQVNGKLCFIVRLSAMPHLVGTEMESSGKPADTDILNPAFRLTSGPGYALPPQRKLAGLINLDELPGYPSELAPVDPLPEPVAPVDLRLLARWQSRERSKLDAYEWYQGTPFEPLFMAHGQELVKDEGYGLGEYGSAWYWVSFDPTQLQSVAGGLDVWIVTANKERIGRFRF